MLTASFLKGNECELCGFKKISKNKTKWTDEVLKQYIKEKLNMIILAIERNRKYIELTLMDKNGYKYVSRLTNILHNKEMGIVHAKNPYSLYNMKLWLKNNNKNFIVCSDKYINEKVKMKFLCLNCNEYFYNTWCCIKNGQECTNCSEKSKGESKVKNFLHNYNIDYIRQFSFLNCRGKKKPLPFDFYLPDYNICIEYQGIQHYKPIEHFGGEEQFKLQQKLDQIKRDYCKKNNIKLIEIPYWYFNNIEEILKNELNLNDIKLAI